MDPKPGTATTCATVVETWYNVVAPSKTVVTVPPVAHYTVYTVATVPGTRCENWSEHVAPVSCVHLVRVVLNVGGPGVARTVAVVDTRPPTTSP